MPVKTFVKRIWFGLKRMHEDPWLFIGSAAVIVALALLTVGAGTMQRVRQNAELRPVVSADATSRR